MLAHITATLANADGNGARAIIHGRKTLRVARGRFNKLRTASTIDLLAHSDLELTLVSLLEAIHNALITAHMRVLEHQVGWVLVTIRCDRAIRCLSLRSRHRKVVLSPPVEALLESHICLFDY